MNPLLRHAFANEWTLAAAARRAGNLDLAFAHLERAHILGQCHTGPHLRSHLGMLAIGWQRRDGGEILGQLARIAAAALFSRIWVPVGNTGGSNVGALRPMRVPDDLASLLERSS